jgi:signal transduction histidine kinase
VESLASERGQTVRIDVTDVELCVRADRTRIRQIIGNLLTNALKFSADGASISVGAKLVDEASVELWVEDHGVGIAPEDQFKIFEPFVVLDHAQRRNTDGVGLGLALVRSLLTLQHGSIRVESERDRGARFIVRLVRAPDRER